MAPSAGLRGITTFAMGTGILPTTATRTTIMFTLYTKLRAARNDDGTWFIYATFYNDDDRGDGQLVGDEEWAVPEWEGLSSEKEALAVIAGYAAGTLPDELQPIHPHNYT